jgi:hypothetical protein
MLFINTYQTLEMKYTKKRQICLHIFDHFINTYKHSLTVNNTRKDIINIVSEMHQSLDWKDESEGNMCGCQ